MKIRAKELRLFQNHNNLVEVDGLKVSQSKLDIINKIYEKREEMSY